MKIWLDSYYSQRGVQHANVAYHDVQGRECDCNPTTSYLLYPCKSLESELDFHTQRIRLVTPHWMQRCAEGRWLVCNPVGTGQIAVVDEEARQVLEVFRLPRTVDEAYVLLSSLPAHLVRSAVHVFCTLSLLQSSDKVVFNTVHLDDDMLTAWLHITNACNLRCHYCYIKKSREHMDEETALRAVDAIFRSARQGEYRRVKIKYAGGEASLEMSRVFALHDYAALQAQDYDIQLQGVLLSNGVLLTQRMIEQLKARHISVSISLDGIGSYHDAQRPFLHGQGSFVYVDRSIGRLLANELVPHISVTISQQNLVGLPDLLTYILQKNLPFALSFYRDNDYAMEYERLFFEEQQMIDAMRQAFRAIEAHLPQRSLLGGILDLANLQALHRQACGVGINYLVIDQYGGVSKCHAAQQQRVTTISASNPLQVLQQDREGIQNLAVEEKEVCRDCTWRYWCGGGCPLLTYRVAGRYDVKSPNCRIYQALFPDVLRLEALRLLRYEEPLDLEGLNGERREGSSGRKP